MHGSEVLLAAPENRHQALDFCDLAERRAPLAHRKFTVRPAETGPSKSSRLP